MNSKTFNSPILILTVICLCIFSSSSAWGAFIMKEDGSSLNVSFGTQQTVRVKTSGGESIVKLKNILWMAGTNIKRIRLKDKSKLLIGEIDEKEIMAGIESRDIIDKEPCKKECNELYRKGQLRQGVTSEECIKSLCKGEDAIIFFYKDDLDIGKIFLFELFEFEKDNKIFSTSKKSSLTEETDKSNSLSVLLLPTNWAGQLKVSKLHFPEKLVSNSNLDLNFAIQGLNNLSDDVLFFNLLVPMDIIHGNFKIDIEISNLNNKLKLSKRSYVSKFSRQISECFSPKATSSVSLISPFFYKSTPFYNTSKNILTYDFEEIYGSTDIYIYLTQKNIKPTKLGKANNNLTIIETLSNVVSVPVNIEKY